MTQKKYSDIYQAWSAAPEAFWAAQASLIDWSKQPETIYQKNETGDRWYVDGE